MSKYFFYRFLPFVPFINLLMQFSFSLDVLLFIVFNTNHSDNQVYET